ncbi:SUKH-4 family immunity protein [Streptomyces sp. NPDC096311]|uniref:SUKH-4 family immunity protein n=1 Tax=Streptomyces sp. NPDC096311 TaxID=3366083 RepID=UPI003829271E
MSQFKFVTYRGKLPSAVSGDLAKHLEERGVPGAVLTIFRAVGSPYIASCAGMGYRIKGLVVGFSREDDEICVDLETGRVLLLASWSPASPLQVNRDIFSFVKSLVELQDILPLCGRERDLDDAEVAEMKIRAQLQRIDPLSIEDLNGFWGAFLDDVGVGDYPG